MSNKISITQIYYNRDNERFEPNETVINLDDVFEITIAYSQFEDDYKQYHIHLFKSEVASVNMRVDRESYHKIKKMLDNKSHKKQGKNKIHHKIDNPFYGIEL